MTFPYSGADISYAQGNPPAAAFPGQFVIVSASRANVGLVVGSQYHAQVQTMRAAGKWIGHYFFNGPVDPVVCANFFVDNLYDHQPDDVLLLDIEATGVVAWNPSQALAFAQQVFNRTGKKIGIYLNKSLMNGANWSALVAFGCWLWLAYYDTSLPAISWWPAATIWQTSSAGYDHDVSSKTFAEINGTTTPQLNGLDPDMYMSKDTAGTEYLHTDLGTVTFNQFGSYPKDATQGPAQIADLFARLISAVPPALPVFNAEQEQIITWFQAQIRASFLPAASSSDTDAITAAINAAVANLKISIPTAPIAAAVAAEFGAKLS